MKLKRNHTEKRGNGVRENVYRPRSCMQSSGQHYTPERTEILLLASFLLKRKMIRQEKRGLETGGPKMSLKEKFSLRPFRLIISSAVV